MISKSLRRIAGDSNVLLSAVIGKSALRVFTHSTLEVLTTEFNLEEVREYIPYLAAQYHLQEHHLLLQLEMLPVIFKKESTYREKIPEATKYLANRDIDDIHLAALALKEKIPIWSNDKDFKCTPIPVYQTYQLLQLLD